MQSSRRKDLRILRGADADRIERLDLYSPWSIRHYPPKHLARFLETRPAFGLHQDDGQRLLAYILSASLVPPSGWLSGFGLDWSESSNAADIIQALLSPWSQAMAEQGVRQIYYTAYSAEHADGSLDDWIYPLLLSNGFTPYMKLRSYDKYDISWPSPGANYITRACDMQADLPHLLQIEEQCFQPPWRHDEREFREAVSDYPYFVVACSPSGEIIGYNYNDHEDDQGFLIRIAVHPAWQHRGVGVRLMAEAMAWFKSRHVQRIMLNTEEHNSQAHALYEWFGFIRVQPDGYVLHKTIGS